MRELKPKERYTYFDYKSARFERNQGMKIDFLLATETLHDKRTWVDLEERAG